MKSSRFFLLLPCSDVFMLFSFAIFGGKNRRESFALISGGGLNRGVDTERSMYVCLCRAPDYQWCTCTAFIRAVGRKAEGRKPPPPLLHNRDWGYGHRQSNVTISQMHHHIIQVWGITDPFLWCLQILHFGHVINSILLFILCFLPHFARSCARICLTRLMTVGMSSQPGWSWFST